MSSSAFSAAKKRAQGVVVTERSVVATLSAPALTVTQNGSASVTVFASRTNYSGVVTPSVSGLPSGVTAAFVPAVLGKGQTSTVMTLSATGSATVVTDDAFTVTLTHALGTSTVNATVTVESTVDPGAPYSVTNVVPSSGSPDVTRAVTITGTGFQSGATVAVGGTAATNVTVVNATTITATLPAKALGTYDLTVTQTEGVATLTNGVSYGAVPFFEDNLAGGTANPANGFTWIYGPFWTVSADYAFDGGTHSFTGTYGPDAIGTNPDQGSADLTFDLGRTLNEVWVEWKQHIPSNYVHRNNYNVGPPVSSRSDNNKFFAIWATQYSAGYQQVVLEINPDTNFSSSDQTATGKSAARPTVRHSTTGALANRSGRVAFIGDTVNHPAKIGQDTTFRVHYRRESTQGAGDGFLQWWANGVELISNPTGPYGAFDPAKFAAQLYRGYFMGSSNSGYTDATTFHLGAFKFYDTDPGW